MSVAKRILIIDDDEATLAIVTEVLKGEGFEVLVAGNGEEGLALFDSEQLDLVITDMVMPVKDGIDTILELRKKNSVLPIIAISAGGTIPKERYLELAGYLENTRTLAKPFSKKELVAIVQEQFKSDEQSPEGIRV